VAQFAAAGLVALVLVGFAGVAVLVREGNSEAVGDAKELTRLAGQGIVQPNLYDGVSVGAPAALARVDRVVRQSVLGRGIVRVKIWTPTGRIVYSDKRPLIGLVHPLARDELRSLRTGVPGAEQKSNLSRPENRFERGRGRLLEVFLPIHTPGGRPLLFEAYLPVHEVSASAHHLWVSFAPALIGGLVLLALVQLPLAWSLAHRLRRGQQEREALLARSLAASEDERRRIARDLHDGVVQDLAGVAYSLAAASEEAGTRPRPELAASLRDAAEETRRGIRALRSLLVEIYPPSLREAGLASALADLITRLDGRGLETRLEYQPGLELDDAREALLYRVAQESLRNVASHARARAVVVAVTAANGDVVLTVTDDGVGFDADHLGARPEDGHVGLSVLAELAREAGARIEIESRPGSGTQVRLEVARA
jgi:signal transduction histidine kinase